MSENAFDLTGKLALVTGGGIGIGFGISKCLVNAGAKVVITGRREKILKNACGELGEHSSYEIHDINELDNAHYFVRSMESKYGSIDVLVNNAGINDVKHPFKVTDSDFNAIMNTNLAGVFSLTREVAKFMVKRKRGSIIMITSMAAIYGLIDVAPYAASKSGLLGLTRSLATDLSPSGVRINAIAPGFIVSPMHEEALRRFPEKEKKILDRTPLKRFGTAVDIGHAVVFLASDASGFITGVQLPVDGGNSIGF
jgi:NAD(P)-dependent dehydrogenase (short-subunit alcohol dehydrogenase family)